MMEYNAVLHTRWCDRCVFGEQGFYNANCAHCPECQYSKHPDSSFMSRETAEMLASLKGGDDEQR